MSLHKDCPKCGERMLEIIAAEAQQRNGWYCVDCKDFIKATGRERLIKIRKSNDKAEAGI